MFIFLSTLILILFITLLIVSAIEPIDDGLSLYEIERRVNSGFKGASKLLERKKMINDVTSIQKIVISILIIIITTLSLCNFGWLNGLILSFVVAFTYGSIARYKLIKKISHKLYLKIEKPIFNFINKMPYILKVISSFPVLNSKHVQKIGSKEELLHLVSLSDEILSSYEKNLISNSLSFNEKTVDMIMTPRDMIISIKKTEFLGPLALNDLHETGHSVLPVITDDIDHIVGMLNVKSLLTLDIKRSTTTAKAMDSKVFYIRQDQTLSQALTAFLHTKNYLFIVINDTRKTVGLITIDDVMLALFGYEMVDNFDEYNSLTAVSTHRTI